MPDTTPLPLCRPPWGEETAKVKQVIDVEVHMTGLAPRGVGSFRIVGLDVDRFLVLHNGAVEIEWGGTSQIYDPSWAYIARSEERSVPVDERPSFRPAFTQTMLDWHLEQLLARFAPREGMLDRVLAAVGLQRIAVKRPGSV